MAQVENAITIRANRAADQAIYEQRTTDMDGDQNLILALPAGEPPCLVLEIQMDVLTFATMAVTPYEFGAEGFIIDVAGNPVDFLGVGKWYPIAGTLAAESRMALWLRPDQPALWRVGERLQLLHPELDTNAAPTLDREVYIRVRRLPAPYVG